MNIIIFSGSTFVEIATIGVQCGELDLHVHSRLTCGRDIMWGLDTDALHCALISRCKGQQKYLAYRHIIQPLLMWDIWYINDTANMEL